MSVRKLIEAAGGKVISFYVTTGETDFLLISEANEAEAIIASLMAAAAAGTISDVSLEGLGPVRNSKQLWKGLPKRRRLIDLPVNAD